MKGLHKIRFYIADKLFKLAVRVSPANDIWETLYRHTQVYGTGMVVVDPKKIYKEER